MTISATVITDSISAQNGFPRATTLALRYPRFIHSEFMTHRALSKNASSSRAIPVERMIQSIIDDTAMPIHWGKNQKGMQANEQCDEHVNIYSDDVTDKLWNETRESTWLCARDQAIRFARAYDKAGYHKQIVNRLLEPFAHINVLVTATEWSNFFALRRHKDAQPEIRELADRIFEAREASIPKQIDIGEWHLPYITEEEKKLYDTDKQAMMSVARCARVSYLTTEGTKPTVEQDVKLYERLLGSVPLHVSPAEHQASPDEWLYPTYMHDQHGWKNPQLHGNFVGFRQLRKMIPGNTQ